MYNESRVVGKIAFITGATSGIGKSCTISLAKLGMNVIITGRREHLLTELKNELEKNYSVKVLPLQLDVRNAQEVAEKIANLPTEWSWISIWVR